MGYARRYDQLATIGTQGYPIAQCHITGIVQAQGRALVAQRPVKRRLAAAAIGQGYGEHGALALVHHLATHIQRIAHPVDIRRIVVIHYDAGGVFAAHGQGQRLIRFVEAVVHGRHSDGETAHPGWHDHALAVAAQGHAVAKRHAGTVEVALTRGDAGQVETVVGHLLARRAQGHLEMQVRALFCLGVGVGHADTVDSRACIVIDNGRRPALPSHRQGEGLILLIDTVFQGRNGHGEMGHARRHDQLATIGAQGYPIAQCHITGIVQAQGGALVAERPVKRRLAAATIGQGYGKHGALALVHHLATHIQRIAHPVNIWRLIVVDNGCHHRIGQCRSLFVTTATDIRHTHQKLFNRLVYRIILARDLKRRRGSAGLDDDISSHCLHITVIGGDMTDNHLDDQVALGCIADSQRIICPASLKDTGITG